MDYESLASILAELEPKVGRKLSVVDNSGFLLASGSMGQDEDGGEMIYSEIVVNSAECRLRMKKKNDEDGTLLYLAGRLIEERTEKAEPQSADELAFRALFSENAHAERIDAACARLRINRRSPKCVLLIEVGRDSLETIKVVVEQAISRRREDFIFIPSPGNIVIIKSVKSREEHQEHVMFAEALAGTLESEYSIDIKIGIGLVKADAILLRESLNEAQSALRLGRRRDSGGRVYQCKTFLNELIFEKCGRNELKALYEAMAGKQMKELLTADMIKTVDTLFENTLNIAETARQLGVHRNTLLYRLERIERDTGFDLRVFQDAVIFHTQYKLSVFLDTLELAHREVFR